MAGSETLRRFSVWMLFGLAERNRREEEKAVTP